MSHTYEVPDVSKKVKFNRKLQEDYRQWEEREVDIYEMPDAAGDDHTDNRPQEGGPRSEKQPADAQRRIYRAAAFCLGVLCILMMVGIIASSIHFTSEKGELKIRYDHLNNNYSQLLEQVLVSNSQLQEEVKRLKGNIEGKLCPRGWKKFGCSCYIRSDKKKIWSDSRADCQQRGADLVVINNKEEQKFVTELNSHGEAWIGLQAKKEQYTPTGMTYEWEWVDGSPLTEIFSESGMPRHVSIQNTSAYCNQHGNWTKNQPNVIKNWICEK
ncbi:CD209 antigen-like protein E isoform X2 [Eleginops maclovinus]